MGVPLALAAALGAALAYFLDPQNGKRRRHVAYGRTLGTLRRGARTGGRLGRLAAAEGFGVARKLTHPKEAPTEVPNDQWITDEVQTEIFRSADVPKGQIDVNTENGVVVLRGEVPRPEMVEELERKVRKVQGVRDVENLLHPPDAEPQMHGSHRAPGGRD